MQTKPKTVNKLGNRGLGMNWIAPAKRLSVYMRDGLACVYCGRGIENDDVKLTLDHLRPRSHGGSNEQTNVVTACSICNSSRGARSWKVFASKTAGYVNHGVTADQIVAHIQATRKKPLDMVAAKALFSARGGFTEALNAARSR